MILRTLVVGPLQVNCFVAACEKTRESIVIDPGDEVPAILAAVGAEDIRVVGVVATHGHFDHIGRAQSLVDETGAPFAVHREDRSMVERLEEAGAYFGIETDPPPPIDRLLEEGEEVRFGEESLGVLHTPGHSPGNIALIRPGHAIVGDTLFAGSVGRTDLEGGDPEVLLRSIREKLFPLGDGTAVHPGHGPSTTIGQERESNPFLNGWMGTV